MENKWPEYEQGKVALLKKGLTSAKYEAELKALIKRLKI